MPFSLTTLATRGVTSLSDARAARAEQKRLRDELASFRTPTERAELVLDHPGQRGVLSVPARVGVDERQDA